MKDFIKKELIRETTEKSIKLFKKYPDKKLSEIVNVISKKYNLTEEEENDLFINTEKKLKDGESKNIDVKFDRNKTLPNSIDFNSTDELEKACNTLMKRGLGWKVKGDESYPFLQFDTTEDVRKAIIFLKNDWDFIEKNTKKVGLISFDNFEDFKKVYDFMKRNNMFIEAIEDQDLSTDLEDNIQDENSFIAKDTETQKLDPNKRRLTIHKKWK